MSEPTFGSEIDNLRAEIATLRQELDAAREHEIELRRTLAAVIDEAAEAMPEPGRIYEYGLSAVTKLVQAKEAAEAENARLRAGVLSFIEEWMALLPVGAAGELEAVLAPPAETIRRNLTCRQTGR